MAIPQPLTRSDYHKIAEGEHLGFGHRDAYVTFMLKRFPGERDTSYATEWAQRFKKGTHWAAADSKSKAMLKDAYNIRDKPKSFFKKKKFFK